MKTFKNLFQQICSFENLLLAAKKAQKGKRFKKNVARFNIDLEKELVRLRRELLAHSYCPGKYHHFTVYEAKKRLISAAPYRDRVVHHALCNIIEPLFEQSFIYDSYACRKGKGTHKAVERFSEFARKNRYVFKCDIRKYFPSIDHQILFEMFEQKIRDTDTLWLIQTIIDSSDVADQSELFYFNGDNLFTPLERRKSLPIGNQTSQFFANVYLNGFDHYVKETLGFRYYIRYVDDAVTLDNDKSRLFEAREQFVEYISALRLRLHPDKSQIFPVEQGTDFLGYRIFPTHRLIRKSNVKRFRRKLRNLQRDYTVGKVTLPDINQRIQSWLGHAKWANSYQLRKEIFSNVKFKTRTVKHDVE